MLILFRSFLTFVFTCFISLTSYPYQDDIIAYVNEDVITSYDLENRLDLIEAINKTKVSDHKKQVLQTLIDEKLLFQIAKRNNISIDEKQITLYANEVAKEHGFVNSAQFVMYYKINQKELMKQIEAQLLLRKFMEMQVKPETRVSKQEILDNMETMSRNITNSFSLDYKTQVKIYEIVLYKNMVSKKDMLQLVNSIYSQLQKGASFESVAKQTSQSNSASDGGLVGFVKASQLSKPIVDAIEGKLVKFKAGYVTPPVETESSVMIIKLADVKKDKEKPKQLSETEVKNILYNKKLIINLRKFVSNLRESSYISVKS